MKNIMLELKQLSKTFNRRRVISDLNMRIEQGELYGFLGPNGAGKTTTIKMITGLLRPDGGSVAVNGFNMAHDPEKAKFQFGFVPDQPFLYNRLTPREYLRFIGGIYGMSFKDCDREIDGWLERFDLTAFQNELIGAFSHGMRQKIAISSALLFNPPLLIIDEPMVGLDPKGAVIVKDLLKEKCRDGMTAFVSTHSLEVAEELADRIGILYNGRLVAEGPMELLREKVRNRHSRLENIFLELTDSDMFVRSET